MWENLNKKGLFYTGSHEGWYSPAEEEFVNQRDLVEDPVTKKKVGLFQSKNRSYVKIRPLQQAIRLSGSLKRIINLS